MCMYILFYFTCSSHTSSLGESKLGISSILRRRKTLLTAKLGTTSFLTDTFAEEVIIKLIIKFNYN